MEVQRVRARARLLFDVYKKAHQVKAYGSLVTKVFKTDPTELMNASLIFEKIGEEADHISSTARSLSWTSDRRDEV